MKTGITTNLQPFLKGLDQWNAKRRKAAYDAVRIEGYRLKALLQEQIQEGAPGGRSFEPMTKIGEDRLEMKRFEYLGRWRSGKKKRYVGRGKHKYLYGGEFSPKLMAEGVKSSEAYSFRKSAYAMLYKAIRYNPEIRGDNFRVEIGAVDVTGIKDVYRQSFAGPASFGLGMNVRYESSLTKGVLVKTGRISESWKRIFQTAQTGGTYQVSEAYRKELRRYAGTLARTYGKTGRLKYFFLRKSTTAFHTPARPIIRPFWASQLPLIGRNIARNFERKMRGERI